MTASSIVVDADDPRLGAAGLADLVPSDGLWTPLRLPATQLPLLHPELALRARMPAGARFAFVTSATSLEWPVHVDGLAGSDYPVGSFDVLVDGELAVRTRILGDGVLTVPLPPGRTTVEVWLPHYGYPRLGPLRLFGAAPSLAPVAEGRPPSVVDEVALASVADEVALVPVADEVAPVLDERPHLVVYGSSISQCREALGPTDTWPALVARHAGWNLRCLGFGGQCHLDPPVARFIRDTQADLIVLCLGINIYGASTFSARSLAPAIAGFIATIRDGHPTTPIVVVTPIVSPDRESQPNAVGLTLADVRTIVAETAIRLRAADPHLQVVDGLTILGADESHLLVDGLHPGPEGYALIADRMLARTGALRSDDS